MIVGEHCRPGDIDVNPAKSKKHTNIRAAASDDNIIMSPPRIFSIEEALEYIADDELMEVTPKSLRLRKRELDATARKKLGRAAKAEAKG